MLNARFEEKDNGMYIVSEDALIDGEYEDQILKLDNCLMEDRKISLDDWLNSTTPHGLPHANISYGYLYYLHPRNKRVVGFWSYSVWAGLSCSGDSRYSDSALGVRGTLKR